MSTYHNINSPTFYFLLYLTDFLCSTKSAYKLNIAWEIFETVAERIVVLKGKNGRRNKDCNLLAVRYSLECSPDCDLGLSEAHVSAHKPVHRATVFHIPLHSLDSLLLVRCILIHE